MLAHVVVRLLRLGFLGGNDGVLNGKRIGMLSDGVLCHGGLFHLLVHAHQGDVPYQECFGCVLAALVASGRLLGRHEEHGCDRLELHCVERGSGPPVEFRLPVTIDVYCGVDHGVVLKPQYHLGESVRKVALGHLLSVAMPDERITGTCCRVGSPCEHKQVVQYIGHQCGMLQTRPYVGCIALCGQVSIFALPAAAALAGAHTACHGLYPGAYSGTDGRKEFGVTAVIDHRRVEDRFVDMVFLERRMYVDVA